VSLPDRPALDEALRAADVAVTWNDTECSFLRSDTVVGNLTSMTAVVSRRPTRAVPPRRTPPPASDADPQVQEAREIEGRLLRSLDHGGFLALRVATSQGPAARRELARFTGDPHRMITVDLERWFLDELRAAAERYSVRWEN